MCAAVTRQLAATSEIAKPCWLLFLYKQRFSKYSDLYSDNQSFSFMRNITQDSRRGNVRKVEAHLLISVDLSSFKTPNKTTSVLV